MKSLPVRLYICPVCDYHTPYRWVLTQHLRNVHDVRKSDAAGIARANEFIANPLYRRVTEYEEEEDAV